MMEPATSSQLRAMRRMLFFLGLFKIPMIGFSRPKLEDVNDETVKISIKLKRRTKNHLGSMYFGALAVGADLTAGIHAFYFARQMKRKISFAFKSMNAEFIKRAETDTLFVCNDGALLKTALQQAIETGTRYNQAMLVKAYNTNNEEVARFTLVASVKVK